MPDLVEFFLNSPARVVLLETVEISHPSFSQVYRIVRNSRFGIDVKLETGASAHFQYYPIRIIKNGSNGNLDQSFQFTVGDVGDIVHDELARVTADDSYNIKPTVLYRAYRSDDLTAPVHGPVRLEITAIPVTREGFAFNAQPYQANISTTGEIYTLTRFPGLRGFL